MREHIPYRDCCIQFIIVKLQLKDIIPDRLIPVYFALLNQESNCCGGKEFCVRCNLEQGIRCNRQHVLQIAVSVSAGINQFILYNYADPATRNIPVFQNLFHSLVKSLHLFLHIDTLCGRAKGYNQRQYRND